MSRFGFVDARRLGQYPRPQLRLGACTLGTAPHCIDRTHSNRLGPSLSLSYSSSEGASGPKEEALSSYWQNPTGPDCVREPPDSPQCGVAHRAARLTPSRSRSLRSRRRSRRLSAGPPAPPSLRPRAEASMRTSGSRLPPRNLHFLMADLVSGGLRFSLTNDRTAAAVAVSPAPDRDPVVSDPTALLKPPVADTTPVRDTEVVVSNTLVLASQRSQNQSFWRFCRYSGL